MTYPSLYRSTDVGASTLNNVVGAWPEILRTCLQNGYNPKTVTSIAVVDEVATATAASHGYTADFAAHVLITGATDPLLNGKKQPLAVATNTFTYAAPGVADGTYTGTMSAKRAPAGWTETFGASGVSIFKPDTIEATGKELRVDDSHAAPSTTTHARIIGVSGATGLSTYSNPFPLEAQLAGGLTLQKGVNTATAKPWAVIANDRFAYLITDFGAAGATFCWFGDLVSYHNPDPNKCAIHGGNNSTAGVGGPSAFGIFSYASTPISPPYIYRDYSGVGDYSEDANQCGPSMGSTLGAGAMQPAAIPAWAVFNTIHVVEGAAGQKVVRGEVPGLACPLAVRPFPHMTLVTGDDGSHYFGFWGDPSGSDSAAMIRLDQPWH